MFDKESDGGPRKIKTSLMCQDEWQNSNCYLVVEVTWRYQFNLHGTAVFILAINANASDAFMVMQSI